VEEHYEGREQTLAKHFILKSYLQALAFKVLTTWSSLTYVDGFSGPWHSRTEDFSDTSFMIALEVLKDAQQQLKNRDGKLRPINCFFSETDRTAYQQLQQAVESYDDRDNLFRVFTYHGQFEDAVEKIDRIIHRSFALIFIDPTGWTGYPYSKIAPLFQRRSCEVVINFMYDHINRFAHNPSPAVAASLAPILGGDNWRLNLDPTLPVGMAVEKLFREVLKDVGGFRYVTSTRIDKSTADRPHFFLAYGTKSDKGLTTFRGIEFAALKKHESNRDNAKQRKQRIATGQGDLFASEDLSDSENLFEIIDDNKECAKTETIHLLKRSGVAIPFFRLCSVLMEPFLLRETDIKDICVELCSEGLIQNTWKSEGNRRRKPMGENLIQLVVQPKE
jgi:three-Cys-motif partner protein